jgi:alpha-mannosidase
MSPCGEILSCCDKQHGREIIAPGTTGNRLQLFDDVPAKYDAWEIEPYFEEVELPLGEVAQISILEAGPLRAALRVERPLTPTSHLVQIIALEAGSRRLDFTTTVEWHEAHKLLKVAFPVAVHSPCATFEIQFGHVERPTHRNTSWDVARFEVAAQRWADLSEGDYGVALLNDCKYGYDVKGNVLRLSLLRAPTEPDPGADLGTHQFTYSLLPHAGDVANSETIHAGYALNLPLRAQALPVQSGVLPRRHSYLAVDAPNLLIETIKRADDGDGIIVRLYEACQRRGTARLHLGTLGTHVTRTDLLERDIAELPMEGDAVHLAYRPFELLTLRVR